MVGAWTGGMTTGVGVTVTEVAPPCAVAGAPPRPSCASASGQASMAATPPSAARRQSALNIPTASLYSPDGDYSEISAGPLRRRARIDAGGGREPALHHAAGDELAGDLRRRGRADDRQADSGREYAVVRKRDAILQFGLQAFQRARAAREHHLALLALLLQRAKEAVVRRAAALAIIGGVLHRGIGQSLRGPELHHRVVAQARHVRVREPRCDGEQYQGNGCLLHR